MLLSARLAFLTLSVAALLAFSAGCGRQESPEGQDSPAASRTGTAKDAGTAGEAEAAALQAEIERENATVIARWDGKELTWEALRPLLGVDADSRPSWVSPEKIRKVAEVAALDEMTYKDGLARGVDKDPQIVAYLDRMRRQLVVLKLREDIQKTRITEEDITKFYNERGYEFDQRPVRLSRVVTNSLEKAREARKRLEDPQTSFEDIVRAYSNDKSVIERGGDIGYRRAMSLKPRERPILGQLKKAGDISDIVELRPGSYAIYKLTERYKPELYRGKTPEENQEEMEKLRSTIRARLIEETRISSLADYHEKLKKANDFALNEPFLRENRAAYVEHVTEEAKAPAAKASKPGSVKAASPGPPGSPAQTHPHPHPDPPSGGNP